MLKSHYFTIQSSFDMLIDKTM